MQRDLPGLEYPDPPCCRGENGEMTCPMKPRWQVDSEEYTDYLCSRHLLGQLTEWAYRRPVEVMRLGDPA